MNDKTADRAVHDQIAKMCRLILALHSLQNKSIVQNGWIIINISDSTYWIILKVALQILGRKFYKNTNKSCLYSQSLLSFIHKTPVVESHLTTREIRELLRRRSTPTGNTVYFYMSSSLIYILEIHRRKFQT